MEVENDHAIPDARSWANLPENVLKIIKAKLYSLALLRFKAVCKRWSETGDESRRPITELPWPTVYSCESRFAPDKPPKFVVDYELCDPQEGKTLRACFDVPEASSYLPYNYDLPHHLRVLGSKMGWVLVEEESAVGSRTLNLYNPFSNSFFPLPVNFLNFRVEAAALSAPPSSPDFVVFVAFRCDLGRTYLGSYRFSDENWDWTVCAISDDPSGTVKSMVYCEGEAMVYFVFEDGKLGAFDFLEKTHRVFEETAFCYPIESLHLIEFEGDILLAFGIFNQDYPADDWNSWSGYHWIVSRFNQPAMSWVSDGLQGRTLFVSDASFCVPAVAAAGGDLGGCVCYFCRGRFWRVYSLRDHWCSDPGSFGLTASQDFANNSFGWMMMMPQQDDDDDADDDDDDDDDADDDDADDDVDAGEKRLFWIQPPYA